MALFDASTQPTTPRKKHFTPFMLFQLKGKERKTEDKLMQALKSYNKTFGSRPCCINRRQSNTLTMACNCLSLLADEEHGKAYCSAVASYQYSFGLMTRTDQYKIFVEFIRGRATFPLPFTANEEESTDDKYNALRALNLCSGSLMDIFRFGKDRWTLVAKAAQLNFLPSHKLSGKPLNLQLGATHSTELVNLSGYVCTDESYLVSGL